LRVTVSSQSQGGRIRLQALMCTATVHGILEHECVTSRCRGDMACDGESLRNQFFALHRDFLWKDWEADD
jgi:hypothetical protein